LSVFVCCFVEPEAVHTQATGPEYAAKNDPAHNKHIWTIIYNFNQVQAITPWWWILCDPKHVGVIFNVCLLDSNTTLILTSTTVLIVYISWLVKVTNNNDAQWKPKIIPICQCQW